MVRMRCQVKCRRRYGGLMTWIHQELKILARGLYVRAALISKSKTLDLLGPIFHDLFSMDRYLINQVDVKVKLYISSTNIALLAKDNSTDYKIQIEDIYILVRKIKVNPAVIYGHSQILEKQNDLYPFTKVECWSQSIWTY